MKIDSNIIAKMAGVSQATVSRAYSNPDKVSEKTRKKIFEIADSLGYKPDINASALRRKGTGKILLIYVNKENSKYWTKIKRNYWVFAEAILSLTRFFENQHFMFEVKQVNSIFSISDSEIKTTCDGIMIFDFVSEEEAIHIKNWDIPYVICHRSIHLKDNFNHSATDNKEGGRLQAKYLQNKGCKSPIYITNNEDPFSHNLRLEGFKQLYPHCEFISISNHDEIQNKLSTLKLENKFDGLAFVNDMLLVQVITTMFYINIHLQNDYPIVGYDNSTELQILNEKPATIEIGIEKIYENAAIDLLKLIKGEINTINLVHKPELIL